MKEYEIEDWRKILYRHLRGICATSGTIVDNPLNSDRTIAEYFDVEEKELTELRDGIANPSEKLVKGIRELRKDDPPDAIDAIFVKPFR